MKNSIGKFIDNGNGFVIEQSVTKTPMNNVLYNLDGFTCEVGQNGMTTGTKRFEDGETAMFIKQDNCALYLKDDDTGSVWCISGFPYVNSVQNYRCEHYDGYTKISSEKNGIEVELRVFVPAEYSGEVFTVTVKNNSDSVRHISIVPAVRLQLDGFKSPRFCERQKGFSCGDFLESVNGFFYHSINPWQKKNDCYCAVLCTNEKVHSYEGEDVEFFGSNKNMSYPYELLYRNGLSSKFATDGEPFAALMIKKCLKPGEVSCFDYSVALVENETAATQVYNSIKTREKAGAFFDKNMLAIAERHNRLLINTPEEKFNYFVNVWLKKGMEYCLQKKNATRDNLQFAHGLTMSNPALIRKELLKILQYQYADGHTVRSWQPMDMTYYADGPLWIVMTTCGYLKISNDMAFLDMEIPYFDGESGTVYEHLEKCIERINEDRGPHNLPLARYADWNDALNLQDENAESVFMAMAFGYMLLEMIELETYVGHPEKALKYKEMHAKLKDIVNSVAWDKKGEYYIRGFSYGERIGASESEGSVIYVNPQSWSIIGGIVTEERLPKIQAAIDKLIETDLGCVVNYPPYAGYSEKLGRISAQTSGTGENGSVYCHATGFKAFADSLCGDGERAAWSLLKILPDSDNNPAMESGALPYAMTSCFNTNKAWYGRAGRPWLTGTQCWAMNTIVEGILGIERAYGGFKIHPSLPKEWMEAECFIKRSDDEYAIKIKRQNGLPEIKLNGVKIEGDFIPFAANGMQFIEVIIN